MSRIIPLLKILLLICLVILTQNKKIKKHELSDKDNKSNQLDILNSLSNSQAVQTYLTLVVNKNKDRIKNHNKNPKATYKMAENKFIKYTEEEFVHTFLNLKIPAEILNQTASVQSQSISQSRLLTQVNVDWKNSLKVTSVKYQGSCGSCYAFSSISAIQSAYIIKGQFVNLSEQQLVDCSISYGNDGCDGGWIGNAYKYILDHQILAQASYPYANALKNCNLPTNKPKYKISSFKTIQNSCSQIAVTLMNQPLTIAINANGWQYYSSGIFTDCQMGPVNHGVLLVGVDSQSWKIKNSWGYAWGQLGYIRIGLNAANQACQVCKYGSYPII